MSSYTVLSPLLSGSSGVRALDIRKSRILGADETIGVVVHFAPVRLSKAAIFAASSAAVRSRFAFAAERRADLSAAARSFADRASASAGEICSSGNMGTTRSGFFGIGRLLREHRELTFLSRIRALHVADGEIEVATLQLASHEAPALLDAHVALGPYTEIRG